MAILTRQELTSLQPLTLPKRSTHTLTPTLPPPLTLHPRKVGEQIERIAHDQAERSRYQGAREAAAATHVQANTQTDRSIDR